MTSTGRGGRIPGLDGLRAVAVALVLLNHVLLQRLFWETAWYGQLGVTLFFVLSGYLITHLLLAERERTGHISLGAFFGRRALRILPVWFAYLATIVVAGGLGAFDEVSWHDVVAASLFFSNMSSWSQSPLLDHGWSLSIEEQFYLLWPLVLVGLLALRRRTALLGLALVVGTAPAWHAAFHVAVPSLERFAAAATPFHADALLWGAGLALALHSGLEASIGALVGRARVAVASLLALLVVLPAGIVVAVPDRDVVTLMVVVGEPAQAALCAVLLAAVLLAPGSRGVALLSLRPVVLLGLASYSVYVWQQPFFLSDRLGPFSAFPLDLVGALAVGGLSWLVVERASDRVRARLRRVRAAPVATEGEEPPATASPGLA